MTCYELAKKFKEKFPSTIAWRIFQNSKVIDEHINPDEEVQYAFVGQKNESPFDIFQTCAVAITNKRLLIGQKRVLFGLTRLGKGWICKSSAFFFSQFLLFMPIGYFCL